MWLLSVGTTSQLTPVCPQQQPLGASLLLACPVADPVAPQPRMLPGSGREEQQLVSVNVSLCSLSTGEVPSVLARRALCPVPVLCGGPHGRVQHAAVHPPGVQGDGCQGECNCWLPSSPASCVAARLCPAQASKGSVKQLLEEPEGKVLPFTAGRRGCCPSPATPVTISSSSPAVSAPVSSSGTPVSTRPCLACAVHSGKHLTRAPLHSVCST